LKKLILLTLSILLFPSCSPNISDVYQGGLEAYNRKEYKTAFEKWEPLAIQGNAQAQSNLGVRYVIGLGVTQDYKEAVKWFRLSAEQGEAEGQYNLGVMYAQGFGVKQDYIQAHKWFSIAGANEYENGHKVRRIIEKRMTPDQIVEAQKLAREWMEKHQKN
jgi:TPR repeat protein